MTASDHAPDAPAGVDLDKPSSARIYDFMLGGGSNYEIDRVFGKRALERFPLLRPSLLSNRRWMGRVVRTALDNGIHTFLDLGSGISATAAVHQIVDKTLRGRGPGGHPGRVVYVDYEPVAVTHTRRTLEQERAGEWVGIVQRDLRDPDAVYADPVTDRLLDLGQPVCVLLASVLQFVGPSEGVPEILARYRAPLPPGSWLAISHPAVDEATPEQQQAAGIVAESYQDTQNPLWVRDRQEIGSWFQGLQPVAPGLVHAVDWRPDDNRDPETDAEVRPFYWACVGELPAPR